MTLLQCRQITVVFVLISLFFNNVTKLFCIDITLLVLPDDITDIIKTCIDNIVIFV